MRSSISFSCFHKLRSVHTEAVFILLAPGRCFDVGVKNLHWTQWYNFGRQPKKRPRVTNVKTSSDLQPQLQSETSWNRTSLRHNTSEKDSWAPRSGKPCGKSCLVALVAPRDFRQNCRAGRNQSRDFWLMTKCSLRELCQLERWGEMSRVFGRCVGLVRPGGPSRAGYVTCCVDALRLCAGHVGSVPRW